MLVWLVEVIRLWLSSGLVYSKITKQVLFGDLFISNNDEVPSTENKEVFASK